MKHFLAPVFLAAFMVLITGCPATISTPAADDLVIFVDLDGSSVTTVPPVAYVESATQNVRWYSNAPDIEIVFDEATAPVPQCTKGRGRCEMRVTRSYPKGTRLKYTAVAYDASGKRFEQDPILVIDF